MDVLERGLRHSPFSVLLFLGPVVLLNRYLLLADLCNDSDVTEFSSVRLCNAPNLRRVVHFDTGSLGSFIPGVSIAPVVAFVLIGKFHAGFVETVGDEACALTCISQSVVFNKGKD